MHYAGQTLVLHVPLAWLGGELYGVPVIFAEYTPANVVTGIAAYDWARRVACHACGKELATVPASG